MHITYHYTHIYIHTYIQFVLYSCKFLASRALCRSEPFCSAMLSRVRTSLRPCRGLRPASQTEALVEEVTGLKPTRANFRRILKILGDKRAELILETFSMVLHSSSVLEQRDYTVGISACGRSNMWEHSCWLLHMMPKARVAANAFTYNAAIGACHNGGQWQHAMILFEDMQLAKVRPNVILYSAAISACAKGARWQQGLELFEAM